MAKKKNRMTVGSIRPVFDQHRWKNETNIVLRILARPDHWASMFFYLFHNVALFRIALEGAAAAALVATVVGVFSEFEERNRDRAVRGAMLMTQLTQLRSLSLGERNAPLHAIIEALVRDGFPLDRIDLSEMILHDLDLSGASLREANFHGAQILNVKFRGADLRGVKFGCSRISKVDFRNAKLNGASFTYAINIKDVDFSDADLEFVTFSYTTIDDTVLLQNSNLDKAFFVNTDLSRADLRAASGLTPTQIEAACAAPNGDPKLSKCEDWNGCE